MANYSGNADSGFNSISRQMETVQPGNGATAGQRQTASSQQAPPPLRKQRSSNLVTNTSGSAGTSPQTSRNTSPMRKDKGPLGSGMATQPSAASIQRALSATSVPSLQSISGGGPVSDAVSKLPRASRDTSSGNNTPQWPQSPRLKSPPASATSNRRGSAPVAQQQPKKNSEGSGQAPSINVQAPTTSSPLAKTVVEDARKPEQSLQAPPKTASRGPSGKSVLETVQENSADTVPEPPAASQAAADLKPLTKITDENKSDAKREGPEGEKHTQHAESGSDSAGSKMDKSRSRRQSLSNPTSKSTTPRPNNASKGSYTPTNQSAKSRQAEGKQNMTVETETVQSIPQSALNAGDRSGSNRNDPGGSVRLKPSTETIRPKKERKKPTQKARSINQGTGRSSPVSRSPLLVSRASFEDVAGDETAVALSWSSSLEDQQQQQHMSYAARLHRATVSLTQRPNTYFRTLSDRLIPKASTKADIFEARVASAVEQENTSDSDETFVYESNPPEPRRPRHHSRTPSVTSAQSAVDQRTGARNFGDLLDEQRRVAGKRSMKFSSNPQNEYDSPDSKNGTVRSHHARHFGKFGRNNQTSATYDPESPFTQASKLRTNQLSTRQSRPNSPRSPQSSQRQSYRPSALLTGRKMEQSFDFDNAEGADDERTPLMGTVRTPRSRPQYHHRRNMSDSLRGVPGSNGSDIDDYYGVRRQPRCGRFGGFLLGLCVLAAVLLCAVAFLVMSNRPLYNVRVEKIQNVLASEQEIVLDLLVGAVNPNPLSISVGEVSLDIFAKSAYVGGGGSASDQAVALSDRKRRRRRRDWNTAQVPAAKDGNLDPWQDLSGHWHAPSSSTADPGSGHHDHGTDPDPDDSENDATTLLLGRVFHFDQALSFEGSPIKRHTHSSLGELRLMRPGNKTEKGGSERWNKVLEHPFELVVRGVLKYQLPVSMRVMGTSIGGSVKVFPEEGVDQQGRMRIEPVDERERWEWVDWESEVEMDEGRVVEVD